MYTDWFKLKRLPFRLRPDPEFLYLCGETAAAFETLRAASSAGRGAIALIGDSGVGKTTLLHTIAHQRQGAMSVARIQQPNLTSQELLWSLCEQWQLKVPNDPSADLRGALRRFVAEEAGHGRSVLILVDEAHRLSASTMTELLGLCARQPAPLVILAGAPALAQQLETLGAGAAVPPITTLRIPPLDAAGIDGYIRHRLSVAGSGARTLFDADSIAEILRYTGGTPQLINELCDAAMTQAETQNTPRVGLPEVRSAAQELKWVEFSARESTPSALGATPARREALRVELDIQQSGKPVRRLELKPGRITIGRGADCGLQLDSQVVSRHHCQIITTAEQSFVEDLGSTNGIAVNGRRRQLHRLAPQDQIVVGDHTLTYLETPIN